MSESKFYQLGTHTESDWNSLHIELTTEGCECETVPARCVTCADDKPHSPTRGTYLLTDQEAEILKNDPRVKFINIDYSQYPEIYKPPADELQASSPTLVNRYTTSVKNYRRVFGLNTSDVNRTGYQLRRCQQKLDPWVAGSYADSFVIESNISQYGTGKDIDIIVGDDGMWFGHPEFQNNTGTAHPTDYVGGNVLPGNGTCDLLDLVLDAPYYLDPAWFDADPSARLTTRWDGTVVPVESVARSWWSNSSQRSSQFSSVGTVSITSFYTRAYNNGSNTSRSTVGQHGTPCCALTYGRTHGWAYNANKWALNVYNVNGSDIEQYFDLMKIFHQLKPINTRYGNKNPTVSSNSWGYRASKGTTNGYYHFRGTATQYGGVNSEPAFISHLGQTGDAGRWKSEMKTNSYTTALDECINSGVIFVGAAGNSNQKQVGSSHPDWNNRVSATSDQTMEQTSYIEFGLETTGSTNRRGFPQQGGMFDSETNERIYPVINIGALDDNYKNSKEAKVNYSDRGEEIDVYAPADGTLAANHTYPSVGNRPDTYPGFTFNGGVATDCTFGGTSAACPVASGFIATVLEHNRGWGWQEVKDWLGSLDNQTDSVFYYGVESSSATSSNWFDYESLEGSPARVLYQGNIPVTNPAIGKRVMRGSVKLAKGAGLRFRP
jgi:hypothetical protein